ncbi:phosphatase PAP2 family protein [Isoptericola sp. b441]|uniref:Phosphatase PAP2 family protein n=1 Tax=Actinotalea lenta TaxID=3064654 RepID=A0ABT9D6T7_9CELL|nr:phosphatase PAP2 family protein [Isoptericola sp. b441]MDO8106546.1 phosphatase PAP2 family protein [Isoptericola sp. b441]
MTEPARAVPMADLGHRAPALAVAVLSAFGVAVVHLLFVTSVTGRRVDGAALSGADEVPGRLWDAAARVLEVVSVPFVVVVVLVTMLLAVLRRRVALAVQVAVLVVGANVTTQVLKNYLVRPDLGLADRIANSLPSGHTTVAASAGAALVLAVPRRFRAAAAVVAAGYTTVTGVATLIAGWHRPADAVAAVLVVLGWAGLVAAFGPRGSGVGQAGHVRAPAALLVGLAVVLAGLSVVAFLQVADATVLGHSQLVVAAVGGSMGIAAAACAAFGVLLAIVAAADPRDR